MADLEKLNEGFLEAYFTIGNQSMGKAFQKFLKQDIFKDFQENRHYKYLSGQAERLSKDSDTQVRSASGGGSVVMPTELPGMVYGMYSEAWNYLLTDIKSKHDGK